MHAKSLIILFVQLLVERNLRGKVVSGSRLI
jgi:hypothetical protein